MYRPVIMGKNGLVTSAHPLASSAGLDVLKEGGNAFDAAIAVNAVLGVVHPHQCGIGGDIFCLAYSKEHDKILFLNGSGRSPLNAGIDTFTARGYKSLPERGVLPVTVPGCVHAWGELWKRFGSRPFARLLDPAVTYAREGFPLSYHVAGFLQKNQELFWQDPHLRRIFMPHGFPAKARELIRQEDLARTLETIGREGAESFYQGEIARKIHNYIARKNGLLTQRDLELHTSNWGEPAAVPYGDFMIYQTPPNTQGLSSLVAFNILEGLDLFSMGCDTAEIVHYLVETKKIAYQYREQYITDPEFVPIEYTDFLDKQYACRLRKMIEPAQAAHVSGPADCSGDTTFFAVADREGNVISVVQSLYSPFGSGCLVDDTGIILQNRGSRFSLDPAHINRLEPHKRTFHTLTACLVTREGRPALAFGTSGGDGQPQTHLQVISKILHFGYNIQEAIEAPRWLHGCIAPDEKEMCLYLEGRFSLEVAATLESWGHSVRMVEDWAEVVGHAQGIMFDPDTGIYSGGADPRSDGYAMAW